MNNPKLSWNSVCGEEFGLKRACGVVEVVCKEAAETLTGLLQADWLRDFGWSEPAALKLNE